MNPNDKEEIINNAKEISGYLSYLDYSNDKFSLISYGKNLFYYCELKIIEDYLYYLNNKVIKQLDMVFIPLFFGNNTIISPKLSHIFQLKQKDFQIDENITKFFNKIKKGVSYIDDNFIFNDTIYSQDIIKDIFDLNFTSFLEGVNIIYQGLLELTHDNIYYYMKYSYPNYNTLKDFQTDFLILDQIDYYLFASYKKPIKFAQNLDQVAENVFYIIVIAIIYIWLLCLSINLIILYHIINDLTEPIEEMQNTIESSSIKDENIFTYEYDDIINELFGTCKELLSGQIDSSNENGLNNFNILSIPKDKMKKIDTNIYKKNLIINNDIINQLINEQQNMMDFSNNIKINDLNDTKINETKKQKNSILYNNTFLENKDIQSNDNEIKDSNKANNNTKNIGEKDNLRYKKLFQIVEFIDYYKDKYEQKNIIVIGNNSNNNNNNNNNATINDSKKSIVIPKSTENFTKKNTIKGDLIDDNTNIRIKMFDEKDISFLWYMEAKQKNNKSFNYTINSHYDELFNDFNDNCKYYDFSKNK